MPFRPDEGEDCPVPLSLIADARNSVCWFKSGKSVYSDMWRYKGNNKPMTNKKNEKWTGWTEFFVHRYPHSKPRDYHVDVVPSAIALCVNGQKADYIEHEDMCVPFATSIDPCNSAETSHPTVVIEVERIDSAKNRRFEFILSYPDIGKIGYGSNGKPRLILIKLFEMPLHRPCLVLLCSEEVNWFTKLNEKM